MKVAILASGGKDSSYAAWWAGLQGWDVVAMVTVLVRGEDSMMFQLQNSWIAGLQASSIGTAWKPVFSNGEEEVEIDDLEMALCGKEPAPTLLDKMWPKGVEVPDNLEIHNGPLEIDGIVVGALRSDYQKTRIERMCERLGVRSFCPLWHKSQIDHMESLVRHGFEVIFTSVSTEGMGEKWLGRKLDDDSLMLLKEASGEFRFNLDGEGGEFETIVTDAPHMKRRILMDGKALWSGSRGVLELTSCRLS
ncbi:MAG: diphthine--ammonia ligase [Candidatus Thermoplasmatota archaeon]|nr:diphthine--ammonia ligase [Candidatus Thermoplasmatota archaeon]